MFTAVVFQEHWPAVDWQHNMNVLLISQVEELWSMDTETLLQMRSGCLL